MAKRQKNGKWLSWLEFTSIKTYLNGSINSKSSKIGSNTTLEEKCESVNLTNYLRGLEVFIEEYSKTEEFLNELPIEFKAPSDIIDYYEEIRKINDKETIAKFKQQVENYIIWLKSENGKGLSPTTAQNYQAHLRGFLKWNNIIFKFRNYNETSVRAEKRSELGIDFPILKEMSFKVIGYVNDFDLKLVLRWLQISGLGSREIFSLRFKDLKHKELNDEFVRINGSRKKTGVNFTTYIYGDVKRDIQKYLKMNENAEDDEYFFGEPKQAYQNFQRRYRRAYRSMINEEYPQYKKIKKTLFTMHGYRGIFMTICRDLRVPEHIENKFVAHQNDNITKAYVSDKELLENFKLIQEELFGVKESSTREEIIKEFVGNLTDVMLNKGKRKTIFNKFENATDEEKADFGTEIRMNYLAEQMIQTAKQEILQDENAIMELANNTTFINKLVENSEFIQILINKLRKLN